MTNLPDLIESEVEKWKQATVEPPVKTAKDINNGHCKAFARDIKRIYPGNIKIRKYGYNTNDYTSFAHIWIEHNGSHYDAECPRGVNEPKDLPMFKRGGIDPTTEPE